MHISKSVGLGGVNDPADVTAVKRRLIELGFTWLEEDAAVDAVTIRAIKLFQAIKNGTSRVEDARNDGRVDPGGDTLRWLQAANAPRWMRFPAGSRAEGFLNFELTQTQDHHDFGVSWLADTILATGSSYKSDYLDSHPAAAVLTINDISLPEGGDTPQHATHESGLACDVRLPRKDGGTGGITVDSPAYDRDAMRAQLRAFRQQGLASRVLLNDPVLVAEGLCTHAPQHHDHAHWEIKPPGRENAM